MVSAAVPFNEQLELLSMIGDISVEPEYLRRRYDPASGIALIQP